MGRLTPHLLASFAMMAGCADSADSGRDHRATRQETPPEADANGEGTLLLWEYPALPYSAQHIEYLRLLQSELGVGTAVKELPPGKKDSAFRAEVNRHNEQTRQRIEAQHGQGTLGRLRQKANDTWEAKVKAAREKVAPGGP